MDYENEMTTAKAQLVHAGIEAIAEPSVIDRWEERTLALTAALHDIRCKLGRQADRAFGAVPQDVSGEAQQDKPTGVVARMDCALDEIKAALSGIEDEVKRLGPLA